jgi:hypothetical protein
MQMFIAVINENFDIAEEAKKGRQASHYWASQRQENIHTSWMKKLNPYRWFAPAPKAIAVDNLPSSLVLPMQKALVQDHSVPKREPTTKVYPFRCIFELTLIARRYLRKSRKDQDITPRVHSRFYKRFSAVRKLWSRCPLRISKTYVGIAQFHQTPSGMKWKTTCK